MNFFRYKMNIMLAVMLLISLVFITGCSSANVSSEPITKTTLQFGTIIQITVFDPADEDALNRALNHMAILENELSTTVSKSDISKFNTSAVGEITPLGKHAEKIIDRSLHFTKISNGKFDITIQPLVELWGIGTEFAQVPSQLEIESLLPKVDASKLAFRKSTESAPATLSKTEEGIQIDLGAIAKGYAADEAIRILKEEGVSKALVNLGGNVYALGSKEGFPWKVGVQDPLQSQGSMVGVVEVIDQAVITSGVYERFYEEDGIRYHHILDPDTGHPLNNEILGITIITPSATDGDALSTVIYSLGLEKGMEMVESLDDVEAIFIMRDNTIYVSTGAEKSFDKRSSAFDLYSTATKE